MSFLINNLSLLSDIVGIIGVFLVLVAYWLLQINKLHQFSLMYSFLNLVGSLLILFSLYFTWNLASGVIELLWFVISLIGVIKAVQRRKQPQ